MHDAKLIALIRDKVTRGLLPRDACAVTWYGPGRGAPCDACGEPIGSERIEVECDLPTAGTIRFHRECHSTWDEERTGAP